ncbi:MAG: winged helix-turn-helix domain-containing protein [Pirellulales bacterium]
MVKTSTGRTESTAGKSRPSVRRKPDKAVPADGSRNARGTVDTPEVADARWTFLTNHSHVLIVLHQEPNLVLREVAARVGITERAVQRIIADLEQGGVIEREKVGRSNVYRTLPDRPLRHPIEAHRTIRELIELIAGPSKRA